MSEKEQKQILDCMELDDFLILEAGYGVSKNSHTIQFKKDANERKYRVSDAEGISYRVMNHWEEKGILPDGAVNSTEDKGWRKFNLVELVWLKMVFRLRDYGVSIEKIAKIKSHVLRWDKTKDSYGRFEFYILLGLATGHDPYLVVTEDGLAGLHCSLSIEFSKMLNGSFNVLLISFKSILSGLGRPVKPPRTMDLLTENEKHILAEIRLGNNNFVRAKIKNNKVTDIESSKIFPEKPSIADIEKQLKDTEAYGELITKYEKGRRQSAILKKSKKL